MQKNSFLLRIAGLIVVTLVLSCADNQKSKFSGPKDAPVDGKWSFSRDTLFFADMEFKDGVVDLHTPLDRSGDKPSGEISIKREIHRGKFVLEDKKDFELPNGWWTSVKLKITLQESSCSGMRNVAKEITRSIRLYYPPDGSEKLFWGETTTEPEYAAYEKHPDDNEKKDHHKPLAKIKSVEHGCMIDGKFVVTRGLRPLAQ